MTSKSKCAEGMNNTPADDEGGGGEWGNEWRSEQEGRTSGAWEAYFNEGDGQYYWRLKQSGEASSYASQETHGGEDEDEDEDGGTGSAFWASTFVPATDGLVGTNGTTSVSICAPLPGPSSSVRVSRVYGRTRTNSENKGTKNEVSDTVGAAVDAGDELRLPPHVSKIYDDKVGHFYFYDSKTGESSWDFPAADASPTLDEPSVRKHPPQCSQCARDTVELREQSTCVSMDHTATRSRVSFEVQGDLSSLGRAGGTSCAKDGNGTLRLDLNGILEDVGLSGAVCGDGVRTNKFCHCILAERPVPCPDVCQSGYIQIDGMSQALTKPWRNIAFCVGFPRRHVRRQAMCCSTH